MQYQQRRNVIKTSKYEYILENISVLPSLPAIVKKLFNLVSMPDASIDDIAELIQNDPALTATILKLANSTFYGTPRFVSSVSGAMVILGLNTIKTLIMTTPFMKPFSQKTNDTIFDNYRFWYHSAICGMAAKTIAQYLTPKIFIDPNNAFSAGIIHDIGMVVFQQLLPKEFNDACKHAKSHSVSLHEAEIEIMGISHTNIGHVLSDAWSLPNDLEQVLLFHHDPQNAENAKELVTIIHYADILAFENGGRLWNGQKHKAHWEMIKLALGLDEYDLGRLHNIVANESIKIKDLFQPHKSNV